MNLDQLDDRFYKELIEVYKRVLITGEWGIGKTYYINKFIKLHKKEQYFVYISLFGIESLEEFKREIIYGLSKTINFLSGVYNKVLVKHINVQYKGIELFSLPYFTQKLEEKIVRKFKNKKKIVFVIDDLERKSTNIKLQDLLGIIETYANMECSKIIIIANENKINDNEKSAFYNFKEKVIQKTYCIDGFSKDAIENVLKDNMLSNSDKFKEHIYKNEINNLRVIKQILNFINSYKEDIKINEKYIEELYSYIICVIDCCLNISKQSNFEESNLDMDDNIIRSLIERYKKVYKIPEVKQELMQCVYELYMDKNIENNINLINKYYEAQELILENSPNYVERFYLSEEELRENVQYFYDNFIEKIGNIDIYNWFKEFKNVYKYSKIIDMNNIFCKDKIENAMDQYLNKAQTYSDLSIIDEILYCLGEEVDDEIKNYLRILNNKIEYKIYNMIILELAENVKKQKVEYEDEKKLDILFRFYNSPYLIQKEKNEIEKKLNDNNYFIFNIQDELDEYSWGFIHKIWYNMNNYSKIRIKGDFENIVEKIYVATNKIGKYRIDSLNSQYHINMENRFL